MLCKQHATDTLTEGVRFQDSIVKQIVDTIDNARRMFSASAD
jgi:hypothetical protein